MSLDLAISESDSWFAYLLQEQYPFVLFLLFHYCASALQLGLFAPAALGKLAAIPMVLLFYSLLGRIKGRKSRLFAFFLYYESIQLAQLQCAFEYSDMSYLWVVSSTIVLTHLELATFMGKVESGLLIGKHFLMWYYFAWQSREVGVISAEGWIALFWSVYHLYHIAAGRKAVLQSRQEGLREVREEKERMQALLQAIPDGVVVVTEDRRVVTYNQMLVRMVQVDGEIDPNTAIYAKLGELIYAKNYKKTGTIYGKLLEDVLEHIGTVRENTSIDFGAVLYEGHYLEWRGTISQWSRTKACVLVVRNVGEWVALEALAKQESEGKSALIRSVSHELRTPINAIINISQELMEKSSLNGKEKELCQVLVSSSSFLLSNVNDLLDFSRIANQKFTLSRQNFSLEAAVRNCAALIEPQCRLKGLYLAVRYDPSIPALVYNDANRLKQVLLNLLSNAVKFTLKGKIELITTLISPNVVKISVEDTGIGIAEVDQRKIFTVFGKLSGNDRLNPQGCGLGLAISSTLVVNMGGKGIFLRSETDHGSTFSFHFPVTDCKNNLDQEFPSEFETTHQRDFDENIGKIAVHTSGTLWKDPLSRANTLIADDSEFNRMVLRRMLESLGFACEEANTGREALRKIEELEQEHSPYLYIFLDIEMPEMTGIEVVREVRRQVAQGRLTRAVVVGCSAYVSSEDRQSCLDAGMDYFLEKPVFRETLVALCNQLQD